VLYVCPYATVTVHDDSIMIGCMGRSCRPNKCPYGNRKGDANVGCVSQREFRQSTICPTCNNTILNARLIAPAIEMKRRKLQLDDIVRCDC